MLADLQLRRHETQASCSLQRIWRCQSAVVQIRAG